MLLNCKQNTNMNTLNLTQEWDKTFPSIMPHINVKCYPKHFSDKEIRPNIGHLAKDPGYDM